MSKCAYVIYVCLYHYHSFPHFHFIHKPLIKARSDNVTSDASPLFGACQPPWGDSKSSKPNMRTAGCACEMPSDQFLTVCLPVFPDVFQVFIDKNTPPPVAYVTLDTWKFRTEDHPQHPGTLSSLLGGCGHPCP